MRSCSATFVSVAGKSTSSHKMRSFRKKPRRPGSMVSGFEAVTKKKQARLIQTAAMWCAEHANPRQPRFDVACVLMQGTQVQQVEYLENAFDTTGSDFIF